MPCPGAPRNKDKVNPPRSPGRRQPVPAASPARHPVDGPARGPPPRRHQRLRPISSFMISLVPPYIFWMRASAQICEIMYSDM